MAATEHGRNGSVAARRRGRRDAGAAARGMSRPADAGTEAGVPAAALGMGGRRRLDRVAEPAFAGISVCVARALGVGLCFMPP